MFIITITHYHCSHTVDVDVMEESELGLAETLLAANTSSLELLLSSNTSSRNSLILQESRVQGYQVGFNIR